MSTMTTTYLSPSKTIDLARHDNLPTLMNYYQASYTHKVWLVKTHNLFFNTFRNILVKIVLNFSLSHIFWLIS